MKRKLPPTAQTAVVLFLIVATCSVLMFANAVSGQSSTWTPEGPLSSARFALAAADVNGALYAVGGTFGSCDGQQTLQAYDDATNTWTTRAPMPTARYHAAAVSLDAR